MGIIKPALLLVLLLHVSSLGVHVKGDGTGTTGGLGTGGTIRADAVTVEAPRAKAEEAAKLYTAARADADAKAKAAETKAGIGMPNGVTVDAARATNDQVKAKANGEKTKAVKAKDAQYIAMANEAVMTLRLRLLLTVLIGILLRPRLKGLRLRLMVL